MGKSENMLLVGGKFDHGGAKCCKEFWENVVGLWRSGTDAE